MYYKCTCSVHGWIYVEQQYACGSSNLCSYHNTYEKASIVPMRRVGGTDTTTCLQWRSSQPTTWPNTYATKQFGLNIRSKRFGIKSRSSEAPNTQTMRRAQSSRDRSTWQKNMCSMMMMMMAHTHTHTRCWRSRQRRRRLRLPAQNRPPLCRMRNQCRTDDKTASKTARRCTRD